MKLRKMLVAAPLAAVAWLSCQKEASFINDQPQLVTAKSEVKTGEVVKLTLRNKEANAVARWKVTPSAGVELDSVYSKDGNEIAFTQPGNYTIEAEVKNVTVNCLPTPGWDTCYKAASTAAILVNNVKVTN